MNEMGIRRLVVILSGFFLFSGCFRESVPQQFYTLSSISHGTVAEKRPARIVVAIGPVLIPDIVDKPQILVRTGDNQIQLSERNRWAGSLKEDIIRVLAENLNVLLESEGVRAMTDEIAINPSFRISVVVNRFDGRPGESVLLNAVWTISDPGEKNEFFVGTSIILELVGASDFESLVAAHSRALATLSRDIANELKKRKVKTRE